MEVLLYTLVFAVRGGSHSLVLATNLWSETTR